jgi:hypothetical protein
MCCSARAKAIPLRHDMLLQAWRQIAHCTGASAAGEPATDRLRDAAPTDPEDQSDIVAVLPSSLVMAEVSLVHPVTTSYSRATMRNAGDAAASHDALKRRHYHASGLPATLSFFPLSIESYGHYVFLLCSSRMPSLTRHWLPLLQIPMLPRQLSSLGRFENSEEHCVYGMN